MTLPGTNANSDKAFHPDSYTADHIKGQIIKTLRTLINEELDGATFTAHAVGGSFRVTIERVKP